MKKITQLTRSHIALIVIASLFCLAAILIVGMRAAYRGKIYPGVVANGVQLGGLTHAQAIPLLDAQAKIGGQNQVQIQLPKDQKVFSANNFGAKYLSSDAADAALALGRNDNMVDNVIAQLSALFGQAQPITAIALDPTVVSDFLVAQNNANATLVENAHFTSQNNSLAIVDSQIGRRLDLANSYSALSEHFAQLSKKPLRLPTISVRPNISKDGLQAHEQLFGKIALQPLVLQVGARNWAVDANTAATWLAAETGELPVPTDLLSRYYHLSQGTPTIYFDKKAIVAYLGEIAREVNVEAIDAKLTIVDGRATIFAQSRDGLTLDTSTSADTILSALNSEVVSAPLALSAITTKADVSNDNIEKLGIKELISEGVSYFPGSPPNRLQNVRTGAKRFNGILLKPGQVFSFGEFLGEVGPAQGYTPGLIILGDHEEMAYGGGLCQVSSTAYRAALLAGLPILERTNHAFAISYYTAPFGVPGVDATIYYPDVDMKFLNDTGHYILIQTEMVGSTLRFRYYGTKTKSGVIRGPFFVSGGHDHTIPSRTVFYRDVLDMAGAVVKTDTVNTYYKSSLDFPITD